MKLFGTDRRLRLVPGAAVLLLSLTGCVASGTGAPSRPSGAPTGPAAPTATSDRSVTPAPPEPEKHPVRGVELALDASTPVSMRIPALDRTSDLVETGLRDDGTLEVPPGDEGSPASWYNGSSTPGEAGAAVLLGHVNSLTDASGVFYGLKTLENGSDVTVTRKDGKTAVFEVYKVESYVKAEFPTKAVYFPVQAAELRLITCDGYDPVNRLYANNLVVYAKLVEVA
jgi:hypothetical protein